MTAPLPFTPDPNTAHPSYAEDAQWVRALGDTPARDMIYAEQQGHRDLWQGEPGLYSLGNPVRARHTLTRHRARGAAVYVGEPFMWEWDVWVDERGAWVTSDSRPVYLSLAVRQMFDRDVWR